MDLWAPAAPTPDRSRADGAARQPAGAHPHLFRGAALSFTTADLCDAFAAEVQVAEPLFRDFGAARSFAGAIETLRVFEDNALVRRVLEERGNGRVLVVDGGGSLRRALVGGRLAALAAAGGWIGIVVHGCIRDSAAIAGAAVGVKALGICPMPAAKTGAGERGVPLTFAGVTWRPGAFVYADWDGLVIAGRDLLRPK
ncbi:MAG: ribonuclease E activity regulator RraA [Gemmatimonadales bacterium]